MVAVKVPSFRLLAGGWLFAWLLGGCATAWQTEKLHSEPPPDLPSSQELTQVPFYPQQRYQCGPAALATVLNFHRVVISPEALVQQVYLPARQGSLQIEMTAAVRRFGMLAYPLKPELRDLLIEVAGGYPVLVLQNLSFSWAPQWHYAVVVGYDLPAGELVLRSGTTRRWRTSLATFERTWARANYWALVIVPAGQIPRTAEPLRYLSAVFDLQQTDQRDAAFVAYEAATRHWPTQPQVWLTFGNAAYAREDFSSAVTAFAEATRIQPDNIIGWNNLAYAFMKMGCPNQARQAVACALSYAPSDSNLQASEAEIKQLAHGRDRPECPSVQCLRP
jgi:tetratricopeptide (TPR) repeat protein